MKVLLLVVYFAVLIGIGLYCRKHTTDVDGFVLGGRSVGPWLTAFAYGTSYFLRGTIRLALRYRGNVGRYRQCVNRLVNGVVYFGTTHKDNVTTP